MVGFANFYVAAPQRCRRMRCAAKKNTEDDLLDAVDSVFEDHVVSGMSLGVASPALGQMVMDKLYRMIGTRKLLDVRLMVPFKSMQRRAKELELPLVGEKSVGQLDLALIQASEFDDELNFIPKGPLASILRSRVVTARAKSVIVVATEECERTMIGSKFSVEVSDLAPYFTLSRILGLPSLRRASATGKFRMHDGLPIRTLDGNRIADVAVSSIRTIKSLETLLDELATVEGLVAHTLFIGQADKGVIGAEDAIIEKYPTVHTHRLDDSKVSEAELKERVDAYNGWTCTNEIGLQKSFSSSTPAKAGKFAQRALKVGERMEVNLVVYRDEATVGVAMRGQVDAFARRHLNLADELERIFLDVENSDDDDYDAIYSDTFRQDPEPPF